ncbi:MAG: phosphate acyltransferase PlsX [Firmicutes bacterium]|nr:phosphate acyltransferase PlsX [Bacillota bacterium]
MESKKIVIDAMGGDYAPEAPVEGALLALEKDPSLNLVLTGTKEALDRCLQGKTYDTNRLELFYATEVVENEEHSPVDAIKKKKDSSMAVGLKMVRQKQADGFISAGNTGALLAGATLLTGRIKGVQRPALALILPTGETPTLLLDVGANMDPKPAWLVQFARMASIYYQKLYGVESPSVMLMNVGVEEGKGNQLAKEAYALLKQDSGINFKGNIEAREVMNAGANIVVTEAFSGNVFLKGVEGLAGYIFASMKKSLYSSLITKIGGLLIKPALMGLKNQLDPRSVGGTPLLGVNGAVIKAHGNSRAEAFVSAIKQCSRFIDTHVNETIEEAFSKSSAD